MKKFIKSFIAYICIGDSFHEALYKAKEDMNKKEE